MSVPTLVPTVAIADSPTPALPTATLPPTATPLPTDTATPIPSPTPAPAVLIGAGDIAYCGDGPEFQGDEKTAALILNLLQQYPDAQVFTTGDTVYGDGTMAELKKCFEPSWGRFKDRIHPVPGNHDYQTDEASPYFTYFGGQASEPGRGYYSYDLGGWHIVALNSNCNNIACGPDSRQAAWLKDNLAASASQCQLIYDHYPRWSSGIAGSNGSVSTFYKAAFEAGVEVMVSGHDHDYERFAPQDPLGNPDPQGIRQFVTGTGGAVLRDWGEIRANSEVRIDHNYGVLVLKLYPGRYEWQFVPTGDNSMTDEGSGECH